MQAAKKKSSSILAQMDNARKYPRFFQANEVKAIDNSGGWEVVDSEDADVFLTPSERERLYENNSDSSVIRLSAPGLQEIQEMGSQPLDLESFAKPMIRRPILELDRYSDLPLSTFSKGRTSLQPILVRSHKDTLPTGAPNLSSFRPTVPSGGQVQIVLAPDDSLPALLVPPTPPDPVAQSFAALAPMSSPLGPPSPLAPPSVDRFNVSRLTPTVMRRSRTPKAAYATGASVFFMVGCLMLGAARHYQGTAPSNVAATHHTAAPHSKLAPEAPATEPTPILDVAPAIPQMAPAKAGPTFKGSPAMKDEARETSAKDAKAALANGDIANASILFADLAENPKTKLDGLTGLGDVAHARGDLVGAAAKYRTALAAAPAFFPARLGLADVTWEQGDWAQARGMYTALAQSYPSRMVPERVTQRMQ